MKRSFLLLTAASLTAGATEPIDLTIEEYRMHRHYLNAMQDSRVVRMPEQSRLPAIAKDARWGVKELQAAVNRGDAAGDVKKKCEANIQEVAAGFVGVPRLGTVEVDTGDVHAVAYVQWHVDDPDAIVVEAVSLAALARVACPIASSIQLWAVDATDHSKRRFEGLISASAASRIRLEQVKDFAQTRYIRLFEKLLAPERSSASATTDAAAPSAL